MNSLGDLRPSQLVFTFGVGSLLDLPNMSALVLGLDNWDKQKCSEIVEDRLLASLKKRVGPQLKSLLVPPTTHDDIVEDPASNGIGVPVVAFPRWLRCPICDTLATIESGVFKLVVDEWRPDRTRYVHASCTKGNNPTALSVRFLLACREGHLTDFPWVEYVHKGVQPCKPARVTLREYGAAGDASDIIVKCLECEVERRMGDAFDRDRTQFSCSGHHPHLRRVAKGTCDEQARAILLGASNSWFPVVMSVMSIPHAVDKLPLLVEEYWAALKDVPSLEVLKFVAAPSRMPQFAEHTAEDLWAAIQAKKQSDGKDEVIPAEDLKVPEWHVFTHPGEAPNAKDFRLRKVSALKGFGAWFEDTVLVERIREVRALMGFTRIESKGDFADAAQSDDDRLTPLCKDAPTWLPVSEVRGEGIFLRLKEAEVLKWENESEVIKLQNVFAESHRHWRRLRKMEPNNANFPGMRFVLLHSLAHALMRQIVLDCGYTAASLRERIYCKPANEENGPMAGFLIYTAASDNEGTLGGLVNLGDPVSLGRHLEQALENLRVCASDPLCSELRPGFDGRSIHGACCHACLFASETSCERGNRYLDRSVLVQTFAGNTTGFFESE